MIIKLYMASGPRRKEKKRKEKRRGYLLFWFKNRKPLDS